MVSGDVRKAAAVRFSVSVAATSEVAFTAREPLRDVKEILFLASPSPFVPVPLSSAAAIPPIIIRAIILGASIL